MINEIIQFLTRHIEVIVITGLLLWGSYKLRKWIDKTNKELEDEDEHC